MLEAAKAPRFAIQHPRTKSFWISCKWQSRANAGEVTAEICSSRRQPKCALCWDNKVVQQTKESRSKPALYSWEVDSEMGIPMIGIIGMGTSGGKDHPGLEDVLDSPNRWANPLWKGGMTLSGGEKGVMNAVAKGVLTRRSGCGHKPCPDRLRSQSISGCLYYNGAGTVRNLLNVPTHTVVMVATGVTGP